MRLEKHRKFMTWTLSLAMAMSMAPVCMAQTASANVASKFQFTYFGQSSNEKLNTFELVDNNQLKFKLNSCSIKEDGSINKKGGKFTTFHDGISYYYTEIDPKTENFELTGTFTVDYINPTRDGQEGFGIIAMDSLGEKGVSMTNHYTNSAAILATKFSETIDGTVQTAKDTVGSRFVSKLTNSIISNGDTEIAENGKNVSKAYSYDKKDLVEQGESYTLTLKKTNTGYHTILNNDEKTERIMYGVDELTKLDENKVYVGFAVARGCNVTVDHVSMKITDVAKDAPALPKPEETVDVKTKVNSPNTYGLKDYPFAFTANANGSVVVKDANKKVVAEGKVEADKNYEKQLTLNKGDNAYEICFTPEEGYKANGLSLTSYEPTTTKLNVSQKAYAGNTIYVGAKADKEGLGTKENPVDLYTAVNYVCPGQTILLLDDQYEMTSPLTIQRGINGDAKNVITMRSQAGKRAVLDFSKAKGGMQLWGNYWYVTGIDVCNTQGNIKGLQVAGSDNKIELVNTYKNGDTGLQISGSGSEKMAMWPARNLILNCTSYDNCDPGMNNADGFAAKITVGEGNRFKGCMAYNNLDDGWDLFAKIETGTIGAVTIEDCIAHHNGTLTNGEGDGDGNGFKLGGDGIAVNHVLKNSISYNNNAAGITCNSNPAVILENNTSYANKGMNIALYGKGEAKLSFKAKNNISLNGGSPDNYSQFKPLETEDNYFFDGKQSKNTSGKVLEDSIFIKTDMSTPLTRKADGSLNMEGLLVKKQDMAKGLGAAL